MVGKRLVWRPPLSPAVAATMIFLKEKGACLLILYFNIHDNWLFDRLVTDELSVRALRWPHPSLEFFPQYDMTCQYQIALQQQSVTDESSNRASSSNSVGCSSWLSVPNRARGSNRDGGPNIASGSNRSGSPNKASTSNKGKRMTSGDDWWNSYGRLLLNSLTLGLSKKNFLFKNDVYMNRKVWMIFVKYSDIHQPQQTSHKSP